MLKPRSGIEATVANGRIRYPLLWLAFAATLLAGAALVSAGGGLLWAGLALLAAPLLALGGLSLAYYVRERRT